MNKIDISRETCERTSKSFADVGMSLREDGDIEAADNADFAAALIHALRAALDEAERERDEADARGDDWHEQASKFRDERDAAEATGYAGGVRDAAAVAYEAWKDGCPPSEISEAILTQLPKEKNDAR
jgi:hypothetical protein